MNAYIYDADIYCEDCARKARSEGIRMDGPYPDGGGEADCPQHCGDCHEFLENPLTTDGGDYVREAVEEATGDPDVLALWKNHYSYLFKKDEEDEEDE